MSASFSKVKSFVTSAKTNLIVRSTFSVLLELSLLDKNAVNKFIHFSFEPYYLLMVQRLFCLLDELIILIHQYHQLQRRLFARGAQFN